MGRKPLREQRRKEIQEALYRCLLTKPYRETTIKDIGREAGLNPAMLHYYFQSKEDILLCFIDDVFDHYRNRFAQEIGSLREEGLPRGELLREVFHFINLQITMDRRLQTAFIRIWELALSNPHVRTRVNKIYAEWIQLLGEIIHTPDRDPAWSKRLAMSLAAFHEGVGLFSVFFDLKQKDALALLEACQERIMELERL